MKENFNKIVKAVTFAGAIGAMAINTAEGQQIKNTLDNPFNKTLTEALNKYRENEKNYAEMPSPFTAGIKISINDLKTFVDSVAVVGKDPSGKKIEIPLTNNSYKPQNRANWERGRNRSIHPSFDPTEIEMPDDLENATQIAYFALGIISGTKSKIGKTQKENMQTGNNQTKKSHKKKKNTPSTSKLLRDDAQRRAEACNPNNKKNLGNRYRYGGSSQSQNRKPQKKGRR